MVIIKRLNIILILLLLLLTLTSCNGLSENWYKTMNTILGFDLPKVDKRIKHKYLNWQEVEAFDIWDLNGKDPTNELETLNQWHRFPIPQEYLLEFYGKDGVDNPKPFFSEDDYKFPAIKDGYYLYLKTETYLFSYIFAVFDTADKKLYYYYSRNWHNTLDISELLGVDLPDYEKISTISIDNVENRKVFKTIDFSENDITNKLDALKQWKKLPLPTEYEALVYGIKTESEDPLYSIRKGTKLYQFPNIETGYYLDIEKKDENETIFSMFDCEDKKLYFYYCYAYVIEFE